MANVLGERNREDNLVINHRIEGEADFERELGAGHNHQRQNIRNQIDGENWQAAAVANVAGDSLQIKYRKWDKIIDMLLRLPFLFLLDQILLQDMGWNGLNNLHRSNYSAQVVQFNGSSQDSPNSNEIQFHFTNDPNFTARKDAYLLAKQEAEIKTHLETNLSNSSAPFRVPVQASAEEVYQNLYGNPDWVALPHFALAYCFLLFGAALFIVIMLNTRQLKMFYTYMICASLIPLSFKINSNTILHMSTNSELDVLYGLDNFIPSFINRTIIFNYLAQAVIGYLLSALLRYQLNNNTYWLINDLLPFSILIPSVLILAGLGSETIRFGK